MSFGYGMVHFNQINQKLNTKSSTEAEVVGVSDCLTYNIWIFLLIEAQGCDIKQNILFQDNQSAINMEKNGKKSCTGKSRHIDICYFFSKDRIWSNKISIAYCSTEHMLTDFFTKSLQQALFAKFHDVIMGWKHVDTLQIGPPSTKDRVGNVLFVIFIYYILYYIFLLCNIIDYIIYIVYYI